jgi:hypothetical protein
VPGSYTWAFDEYTFLWNTWWFRYSLLNLGQSPLYSTYTFYPLGIGLAFYTYNVFNAALSIPLQPYLSLPAISNLTFLLTTVLSGYGTFLLVEYLLRDDQSPTRSPKFFPHLVPLASFLAGLLYAFGSYRMVYAAIGHYNLSSTAWIPFYTLFLVKTIRQRSVRYAALAGVFLAFAMLCDMMFGVFLAMLTLLLLLFALGRERRNQLVGSSLALVRPLLVLVAVATLLYLPMLVPILKEMFSSNELAGWGDAQKLSVDLLGLITPTALHPLGGGWVETLRQTQEGTSRFLDINTVFLGWAGLALGLVGAVRYRRQLAAWITGFLLFTILSLGPVLQINGQSLFNLDGLNIDVPLPFILLHYIPIVNANRVPNRFSVVLMLTLAVLVGFGSYWLFSKLRGRVFPIVGCSLLACLLLFEHWSVPLPLTDARIPKVYRQIAADPDDSVILQLPLGWRNSFGVQGAESTQTQYYQSYHHKRLLSGNISRNPPFKFDYFRQVPILDSLITIQTYGQVSAERRDADRATAADFVSFYDIRYVVVAPGVPGRPPYVDTRDAAVAYIEDVLPLQKVFSQDGWILYRVEQPSLPSSLALDLGSSDPLPAMALGEGWAGTEEIQGVTANWATSQDAQVFLPATGGADYQLTMAAQPFDYPGAPEQTIALKVNGHRLERTTLSPGWANYAWDVPAEFLQPGLNSIQFEFARLDAPADVLPGNGAIGQTGVQSPVPIEVNSGGPAAFAYISIGAANAAVDGSVHAPGYNVAVIDRKTGKLLDRRGFDLTSSGSEAQAAALADFIAAMPQGRIVVVALQGQAEARLTDRVADAFRSIGGTADLAGVGAWSHAIIGVKGAAPGTALELAGPDNSWLHVVPDHRTLSVAVDTIIWQQTGGQK